jgi:hypothetical protein
MILNSLIISCYILRYQKKKLFYLGTWNLLILIPNSSFWRNGRRLERSLCFLSVYPFVCLNLFVFRFLYSSGRLSDHLVRPEYLWKKLINFMLIFFRPPLWSTGQSSWLQIQTSGFDSRRYQIFWVVVGLERGPLTLVRRTEELLERKSSGSCLESREYCSRDPSF